jgi:hypothetical protein
VTTHPSTPSHLFFLNHKLSKQAGHAIEARVYAENPLKGFLPATGKLLRLKQPVSPSGREFLAGESDPRTFNDEAGGGGAGQADVTVRVDTGVREGDEVTMFYDPMISKLIVHAPDRPRALHALQVVEVEERSWRCSHSQLTPSPISSFFIIIITLLDQSAQSVNTFPHHHSSSSSLLY